MANTPNIPIHPRGEETQNTDKWFKLRNTLNIIFILGVIVGIVLYFAWSETIGTCVLLTMIVVKIIECSLRLIKK